MTSPDFDYDVAIVGAGFAGLYLLHRCRTLGLSARIWQAGDGVGGTWYWNRYPGARCLESVKNLPVHLQLLFFSVHAV